MKDENLCSGKWLFAAAIPFLSYTLTRIHARRLVLSGDERKFPQRVFVPAGAQMNLKKLDTKKPGHAASRQMLTLAYPVPACIHTSLYSRFRALLQGDERGNAALILFMQYYRRRTDLCGFTDIKTDPLLF